MAVAQARALVCQRLLSPRRPFGGAVLAYRKAILIPPKTAVLTNSVQFFRNHNAL